MSRWPGGIIRKTPVTPSGAFQCSTAPGVWSLADALYWQKQGKWPTQGNQAGQQAYTTAGTYSWVAPAGVTKVSVVAIGGGAGGYGNTSGAGGELRYINNVSVTPGNSYSVTVGAGGCHNLVSNQCHGKPSTFSSVIQANGGGVQNNWPCSGCVRNWQTTSGFGGTGYVGGQGRNGVSSAGGGGAGGYSGTGGLGGSSMSSGSSGSGGAAGGGAGNRPYCGCVGFFVGGAGGGTGILGAGCSGAGGTWNSGTNTASGGGGGSGGNGGQAGQGSNTGNGGLYGGGGGSSGNGNIAGYGAAGAVRIIWPGCTRQFPSTCTGNL